MVLRSRQALSTGVLGLGRSFVLVALHTQYWSCRGCGCWSWLGAIALLELISAEIPSLL
ncbi:hypothetical protein [Nostoc sp.]|uniref:hypothetical protein n=1 Tax=Nostoc sp. TaxID=1180 RepID=UPI002FF73A39